MPTTAPSPTLTFMPMTASSPQVPKGTN
jgi:hypothetical protein